MRLGEKLRYLREVEGTLRGLDREMTQQEVVRALKKDLRQSISQSYLSQIESGARPHLTNATRMLLARFFKVHPGYLVDDPEGFHTELISDVRGIEDQLDLWLIDGAERLRRDPEVSQALLTLARHADSRRCLLLLEAILDTPGLADRLFQVLRPEPAAIVRRSGDVSVRQAL
jgi:transcriptional regulator with XRE-family HTH domain